ncbi:MAG: DUF3516 domain-containing protein [Verrucomicrobiota bacterium]
MDFPLTPLKNPKNTDEILEAFLDYLAEKNIEPYPAQEEAILEIFADKNLILNTPTGSGKSLVAAAMHFYSASQGRRSVYTCPIKALVNEKFLALCRDFGPENVGMMTGDASVNQGAPILCCTAEILANIALRDGENARVNDVIMDEFHYYSDHERGVAWQAPLLTLPHCRFLLISATLGETHFFSKELESLTGAECVTVSSRERPVPLEFTYQEIHLTETLEKLKAENKLPVYIVHFTQKNASDTAQNLISLNPCTKEEKKIISEELKGVQFTSPFGKEIQKLLKAGIGLHHAGLLPKYRVLIEKFAQKGLLKFICGTDTLGVGVNVPIRTVLFTQLCKYGGQKTSILSSRDFHQISGRAGRKGFDDVGYVVALAPDHVIENLRQEQKASNDPKKKKKLVKKKPPERGYVHWDESTYTKLQAAPPEALESRFKVSHGMLLNVLSRPADGCRAMRQIIDDCHSTHSAKKTYRKQAFQLFRALVERNIIEIVPQDERPSPEQKLRVNVELQDDFSLNQTLALYCIDTLALLNPEDPDYALKLLSLVESTLENPDAILRKQLDKIKTEKVAEMKADGIEYEERMEKLETLEYPKPESEFIYQTFNEFARSHPWIGGENIKPKSIAREMFERYASFSDYVKTYGLQRAEGLLLRHLANVYRFLSNSVPPVFKTETVEEISTYLEHLLKHTDSSLIDEWELLKDPNYQKEETTELPNTPQTSDIARDKAELTRLVRAHIFKFIRHLANKHYQDIAETYDLTQLFASEPEPPKWLDLALEQRMAPYYESRSWIRLDPAARNKSHTHIITDETPNTWHIHQTLIDPEEQNDWTATFQLDIEKTKQTQTPSLTLISLSPTTQ